MSRPGAFAAGRMGLARTRLGPARGGALRRRLGGSRAGADGANAAAWRGLALLELGRRAESGDELSRAVALDRKCSHAWAWLGRLRLEEGRPRQALEALSRAVEYGRRHPPAYVWRAQA